MEWASALAVDFLSSVFHTNIDDRESIGAAVLQDFTLMIVACKITQKGKKPPKPLYSMYDAKVRDKIMVLGAACFRHGSKAEVGMGFVSWLAVATITPHMPIGVESWQRMGIGRFFIILVVKRLTMALLHYKGEVLNNEVLMDVEVFLQSTTSHAYYFFRSCGFKQINLKNEDNRELLPESLQERVEGNGGDFWWVSALGEDEQIPRLLYLAPGQFVRKPEVIRIVDSDLPPADGSKSIWCRYPPASSDVSNLPRLSDRDMSDVFIGLDLLENLLPLPINPVLPPGSIHVRGEMLMKSRRDHGIMKGKGWMSTGELDLLTSLVMRDGRYDDSVAIVPFAYVNSIAMAFEAYKKATEFQDFKGKYFKQREAELKEIFLEKYNADVYCVLSAMNSPVDSTTRNEAVAIVLKHREESKAKFPDVANEKFQCTEGDITRNWQQHMNFVAKTILSENVGLIQKKVVVFPRNLANSHWMVTFVFNPSSIDKDKEFRHEVRPCFFRYCSKDPSGSRKAQISHGLIWFLNFAYSHAFCRKLDRDGVMKMNWETPFGTELVGCLRGTKEFPSLRLDPKDAMNLPLQLSDDNFNCGFGVVATIAIVLRDCIGRNLDDDSKFSRLFSTTSLRISLSDEERKEHICKVPNGTFEPLPQGSALFFGKTYLENLREQWFIVLDRLAKLQHYTLKKRQKRNFIVDEFYVAMENDIEKHKWPSRGIVPKQVGAPQISNPPKITPPMDSTKKEPPTEKALPPPDVPTTIYVAMENDIEKHKWPSRGIIPKQVSNQPKTTLQLDSSKKKSPPSPDSLIDELPPDADLPPSLESLTDDRPPDADLPPPLDVLTGEQPPDADLPPPLESLTGKLPTDDDPTPPPDGFTDELPPDAHLPPPMESLTGELPTDVAPTPPLDVLIDELPPDADLPPSPDGLTDDLPTDDNPPLRPDDPIQELPPDDDLPPPEDPRIAKQWEHVEIIDDETQNNNESYEWPQLPTRKIVKDDWDGKTKEENNWKPKWAQDCDGDPKHFFGDEPPEEIVNVPSYFDGTLTNEGVEEFTKTWYNSNEGENKERKEEMPIPQLDPQMMEKFVNYSFQNWGWSSNKQFIKDMEKKRTIMKLEQRKAKSDRAKSFIRDYYLDMMRSMKKERRHFRKQFETMYKLGNPAAVRGLKYNQESDTFTARCVYKVLDFESNETEELEEEMVVSEEWVKLAGFSKGVVQHVINMNSGSGFVPVPEGTEILMNTRKVVRVRYVHPIARWVMDVNAIREKAQQVADEERTAMLKKMEEETGKVLSPIPKKRKSRTNDSAEKSPPKEYQRKEINGKQYKKVISAGYWQVIFRGKSQTMRADEAFVKANFQDAYLDELMRVKRGFVDIPVGDFKVSCLSEHPSLHVHGAPKVNFPQSDGQDLCVSKSLASALYALGFHEEASKIDAFGMSDLQGGAVDAFGKVSGFAKGVLPSWIVRKWVRRPEDFSWQTDLGDRTILLGVLNASDGNCSHAITVHGGFIYDANEQVSIPLCQEALDYCTSTATEKSTFVNFRRIVLFYYEGKNGDKVRKMSLVVETDDTHDWQRVMKKGKFSP